MSRLGHLRSRLNALRRRRRLARLTTAFGTFALAGLWILALAFVVDWSFEMSRPQRLVLLLLAVVAAAWAFRRFAFPLLGLREDVEDVALLVEKEQRIDSDLVAALQFESSESSRWGSSQLQSAVVEYVGEFSPTLDVFQGFSPRQAVQRIALLTATVALLGGLTAAYPAHAAAFLDRFLLGSRHYPTRTVVAEIRVNDQAVFVRDAAAEAAAACPLRVFTSAATTAPVAGNPSAAESRRIPLLAPYGKPLRFAATVTGEIPETAQVKLTGRTGGVRTEIELHRTDDAPVADDDEKVAAEPKSAVFAGLLPRLVDSVEWQLEIGDAWTDPARVDVIPLPVVSVELDPHPPGYAKQAALLEPVAKTGVRQLLVIEGTRVDLAVRCTNKTLRSATLTLGEKEFPLAATSDGVWTFPAKAPNPLAVVKEAVRYAVQVVDADGLSLDRPIEGYVGLKPDREPRISAHMVRHLWLPEASPKIRWGASDDFGVSRVVARVKIVRADGKEEEDSWKIAEFPAAQQPHVGALGEHPLDLSRFKLSKGDELKVTLEAFDFRGDLESKSSVSEALPVQITDRAGVAAALLETDQKSAEQLDAIILRELGIGESK